MQLVCPACSTRNRVPDQRLGDQPVCGRCGAELMSEAPVALDDRHFADFIAGTELPVLVDFWADWCAPCKMMAPQFEAAARQRRDVRFVKVDSDASPATSARHGIRSIPTMVLFRGGEELARVSGAMPSSQLLGWLQQKLG